MSGSKIVVVLTGSIACYKACDAVSRLVKLGHEVRVVATASALKFVGAPTLEGLTGSRVLTDLFESGAAMEHIELTRWADLVLVCPATAHTLNRLAAGLADDLAGALFLAHDRSKPFLVAPAMNPMMWQHPATQNAVDTLCRWGVRLVYPGEGRTACGEVGEGRLAEPPEIVAAVEAALARPGRRLRVLVTSGGTREPLDSVRFITNASTGSTGAGVAERLARSGHEVVFLRAVGSAEALGCREETYGSFRDLDAALGRLLGQEAFDAIIHAAAVSDFGVGEVTVDGKAAPVGGKLPSGAAPTLRLTLHPKLVDSMRARSLNPRAYLVAFKLTDGLPPAEARAAVADLLAHSGADAVVHNDLSRRLGRDAFPSEIHFADGRGPQACPTRAALAEALEHILSSSAAGQAVAR